MVYGPYRPTVATDCRFIPKPKATPGKSGQPPQNLRDVLNGILWILRIGAQWADLPVGLPIAVNATTATTHEVTLVYGTGNACFLGDELESVIGKRAYDSDRLDERLAQERGIEMIAPDRCNRREDSMQDGRALRRYRRRQKGALTCRRP